jgi:hypothetical protein
VPDIIWEQPSLPVPRQPTQTPSNESEIHRVYTTVSPLNVKSIFLKYTQSHAQLLFILVFQSIYFFFQAAGEFREKQKISPAKSSLVDVTAAAP